MKSKSAPDKKEGRQIGFAVVGLGWIAQAAALPSFKNAAKNSKVVALVSGDVEKLKKLGQKYRVPHLYRADQYEECLKNSAVQAVYLALPNHLHAEYTETAARYGKHVLCEKPMAVTASECERMRQVCRQNKVRLMIAYRLHFDPANTQAVEWLKSEKIGTPRIFSSVFTYSIKDPNNYRLKYEAAGGPLFDIGIYCINAARYLFQSEPVCVTGMRFGNATDPRFSEVEETFSALLKFSNGRSAQFTCGLGASDESSFQVVGTKGKLEMDRAFEIFDKRTLTVTVGETEKVKEFPATDQFGPEFLYFSDCILNKRDPEPSGLEGQIDVQIMQSLYRSASERRTVTLEDLPRRRLVARMLPMSRPALPKAELVRAMAPAA